MINKILIAFDGSETSVKALRYAAEISSITKSELIVLFVIHEMIKDYGATKNEGETLKEKIQDMLNTHIDGLKQINPGLKTHSIIVKGTPTSVIVETAKKENADLIVMGSKGFRVKDLSLGSISSSVVNISPINVLIVK